MSTVDRLQENGSGWTLQRIEQMDVTYNKSVSLNASSYIPTPKTIKLKHAIINVKNDDNKCFVWAVLSRLYEPKASKNQWNISYPVSLSDIDVFEDDNPTVSVNVYILEKKFDATTRKHKVFTVPIRLTENVKTKHTNLLLLYKNDEFIDVDDEIDHTTSNSRMKQIFDDSDDINKHYCWIKNFSALVGSQVSKNGSKLYFCDRCLNHFYSELHLERHVDMCKRLSSGRVDVPNEENCWVRFKNYQYKLEIPFIIYADIESLLLPITDERNDNFSNDESINNKPPKGAYQKHIPNSIAFYFLSRSDERRSYFKSHSGPDCIKWFMERLFEIAKNVYPALNKYRSKHLSDREEAMFRKSTVCHICEKTFECDDDKVRDHCHMSGVFRGAAHSECNKKFQTSKVLPIGFHNLDYDSHFLIEQLASQFNGFISIIPKTNEKYISFTKILYKHDLFPINNEQAKRPKFDPRLNLKLRFIDSFRFLQCSLGKLASFLPHDKMLIMRDEWKFLSESDFKLLTKKGVYPYSYMDSWEKLNNKELPTIDSFYDTLTKKSISPADYEFAKTIWSKFNIQNMRQYTELYLKTDVLLLADVFENFRNNCFSLYRLDPAHYFTLPGYSWDCMLKTTKVEIELFTDIDKVTFIERGLRGGISQCSKRYCKANNKYMNNFDSNQPSSYLMYFDVNNLYGWAMSQALPISNFVWIETQKYSCSEIEKLILNTPEDSEIGYMLEVDLKYPSYLHDLHNDYPFCCEHMQIGTSHHQQKLILSLNDKFDYVLHYRTLKLALANGLRLMEVHRLLKFKQSRWLEKYIILNTHQRAKSKNDFEKN